MREQRGQPFLDFLRRMPPGGAAAPQMDAEQNEGPYPQEAAEGEADGAALLMQNPALLDALVQGIKAGVVYTDDPQVQQVFDALNGGASSSGAESSAPVGAPQMM